MENGLFTLSLWVALYMFALGNANSPCAPLVGVDDNSPGALRSADLEKLPANSVFISLIETAVRSLPALETPVQFHFLQRVIVLVYSAAAAFDTKALDFYGRVRVSARRRRCQPTSESEKKLFNLHRRITIAYAFAYGANIINENARIPMANLLQSWGLDYDRCPKNPTCLSTATPWGLAWTLRNEGKLALKSDGWNYDGSLSRKFNKIPYQDWRSLRYVPVNTPWNLLFKKRWQPLLEQNGLGFLSYQEHVTPHVGNTAVTHFISDRDVCSLKAPDPKYNLDREISKTFRRTSKLNDIKKAEIELFDNKFTSLLPLQVQYFSRRNVSLDSFEFIVADTTVISALYESLVVVWKEKVRYDLVRPPSYARARLGSRKVEAFAGKGKGTRRIAANEWEPYIRTMPHAEYPSGSACSCKAFEDAMKVITKDNNFPATIGGALVTSVPAGSLRGEPGSPKRNLQLSFPTFEAITKICSRSRLNGGMHFTASVSAGEDLCGPVGTIVAKAFLDLSSGKRPKYIRRFPFRKTRRETRCRTRSFAK